MNARFAGLAALFLVPESGVREATKAEPEPAAASALRWHPPVADSWPPATAAGTAPDHGGRAVESRPSARGRPEGAHAAVVGIGAEAVAVGAALAGELRCRNRARVALLLVFDPVRETPAPLPAWPSTRALGASLGEGHAGAPRGRLVVVQLPSEPRAAVAAADRLAREAEVPTVLVVGGPRASAFDDLLARRDVLVVVESDGLAGSLAELATAELSHLNPHVVAQRPIGGIPRRLLARLGLGRARSLGARLDAALR